MVRKTMHASDGGRSSALRQRAVLLKHGADVDDATSPLVPHMWQHGTRHPDDREEVRIEDARAFSMELSPRWPAPHRPGSLILRDCPTHVLGMKPQVILYERGDEVIAVVVAILHAQPQRHSGGTTRLLEQLRL